MHKPQLMTHNRIPESLANLCYRSGSSVMDIYDAVEDSATASELVQKINSLDLLRRFTFDRETETYIRLKAVDTLGNVSYLIVSKGGNRHERP